MKKDSIFGINKHVDAVEHKTENHWNRKGFKNLDNSPAWEFKVGCLKRNYQ